MAEEISEKLPFISYGRQSIDQDDVDAVSRVLFSDWLTTGPKVTEFEEKIAAFVGARFGVAVNSGTAALHAAMYALGIGPGDEVIVPAMTFAATANAVVYQGGRPVFVDVEAETLLISSADVERLISARTKAIVAVDYAGQPCDYEALRAIADLHGLALVADGCHSLGASENGNPVGTLADMTVFSFHPVKHITTGEGGMIVSDNEEFAAKMQRFRNHGISTDHFKRQKEGTWHYEMVELGFNYRISDILCALGISQLQKLPGWLARRRAIAERYDLEFQDHTAVTPLSVRSGVEHAYHLYVVQLAKGVSREKVFRDMRQAGIGVNVHYVPVHMHPFYRNNFGTAPGLCPVAEEAYERVLSLPMHQGLSDDDVQRVTRALWEALK
ncbi:MAG: UDP-4-amino-4,6-dideoxy-N-acetyl-beta-L-altrosamine transaminase [Proteobacteria bacterium]|nr:UDP-4-amino-4,6-dideoxy-N-acetyl-beta-L-altrosamine transaminase [Pseudomonadota bacterium]MBU1715797.1 UDP-4-amino-4,6-dideoxy-N-acetyl-beta-L-altrosamine transaminase [Pseudomonadota bacterium]